MSHILPQDTGRSHQTPLKQPSVSWQRLPGSGGLPNWESTAGLACVLELTLCVIPYCFFFFTWHPRASAKGRACLSMPRIGPSVTQQEKAEVRRSGRTECSNSQDSRDSGLKATDKARLQTSQHFFEVKLSFLFTKWPKLAEKRTDFCWVRELKMRL